MEIFSTLANLICMMGEYNRSLAKNLLYPNLPAFTQALVKGLQVPDGFTSDSGLKKEILSGENCLLLHREELWKCLLICLFFLSGYWLCVICKVGSTQDTGHRKKVMRIA